MTIRAEVWGDTIRVTGDQTQAMAFCRLIAEQREREAMFVLSPELRPKPCPYVWIDPWEDRE